MQSGGSGLNIAECLRQGAVGAVGAIPGTTLAHPFDLLKIRMQTGAAPSLLTAVRGVQDAHGPRGFYRGLAAGVQQKVLTRGPMFLASEAGTQLCERQLGLSRTPAVFFGSLGSGYTTGSLAALAEWRKVLGSGERGWAGGSVLRVGWGSGQIRSVWRRVHGAGVRNAIFDGTFFGASHVLGTTQTGSMLGPGPCYAAAATAAVVTDYAVDAAVKRSMAVEPTKAVGGVLSTAARAVATEGRKVFIGLSAKSLEFAT